MIDWLSVVLNGGWILGLAVILATVSYHNWAAETSERSLRRHLKAPSFNKGFAVGACLFCSSLAGLGEAWWERVVWGVLALLFAAQGAGQKLEGEL